jgi:hypothetical protein
MEAELARLGAHRLDVAHVAAGAAAEEILELHAHERLRVVDREVAPREHGARVRAEFPCHLLLDAQPAALRSSTIDTASSWMRLSVSSIIVP